MPLRDINGDRIYQPPPPSFIWLRRRYRRLMRLVRPFIACDNEYRDGFSSVAEQRLWARRARQMGNPLLYAPNARLKLEYDWGQRFYVLNGELPKASHFEKAMLFCHQGWELIEVDYHFHLHLGTQGAVERDENGDIRNIVRYVIQRFNMLADGALVAVPYTDEQLICIDRANKEHTGQIIAHTYSDAALNRSRQLDIDGGGVTGTPAFRQRERALQVTIETQLNEGREYIEEGERLMK
jgi:hypothetical protein